MRKSAKYKVVTLQICYKGSSLYKLIGWRVVACTKNCYQSRVCSNSMKIESHLKHNFFSSSFFSLGECLFYFESHRVTVMIDEKQEVALFRIGYQNVAKNFTIHLISVKIRRFLSMEVTRPSFLKGTYMMIIISQGYGGNFLHIISIRVRASLSFR